MFSPLWLFIEEVMKLLHLKGNIRMFGYIDAFLTWKYIAKIIKHFFNIITLYSLK